MGKNDASLSTLWNRLLSVSELKQDIRFGQHQASGEGEVVVSYTDQQIIWAEKGTWIPPNGTSIPFTNSYYWLKLKDGNLEVGHLRLGPENPVKLVELVPTEDPNEWKSVSPHLCGEDLYVAEVTLLAGKLLLFWDIQGPGKKQELRYTYY
ncbi:MAG: DUF6314 family protein [Bacteroidota bacterium]